MTDETPEQRAKRLGVHFIKPTPAPAPPFQANPVVAVCGECGRDVYRVEGYSCPRNNCPTDPNPFSWSSLYA